MILQALHDRLPAPQQTEMGLKAPSAKRLNVECWANCQAYGDDLTQSSARPDAIPNSMTVSKVSMDGCTFRHSSWHRCSRRLIGSIPLDDVPTVTIDHWQAGQAIAEDWRKSAHRLLEQLDKSGEALHEKRHQDRLLTAIRNTAGNGIAMRDLYRKLNLPAKQARHYIQDLIRAGLVEERRMNRAEWYIATEFVSDAV